MIKPQKENGQIWKPKKSKSPDVGSYENATAYFSQSIIPKAPAIAFSKNKNQRFNMKLAKSKAFVPGSGNYNIECCYKNLSVPLNS